MPCIPLPSVPLAGMISELSAGCECECRYLVQALLCLKMHQIAAKMQHTETEN